MNHLEFWMVLTSFSEAVKLSSLFFFSIINKAGTHKQFKYWSYQTVQQECHIWQLVKSWGQSENKSKSLIVQSQLQPNITGTQCLPLMAMSYTKGKSARKKIVDSSLNSNFSNPWPREKEPRKYSNLFNLHMCPLTSHIENWS